MVKWNRFFPKLLYIILNDDRNLYEIDTSELEKVATVKTTDLFQCKTNWSEEKKKKKNIGLIVGVTVTCVVVVAIIVVVVVIVVRRKQGVN